MRIATLSLVGIATLFLLAPPTLLAEESPAGLEAARAAFDEGRLEDCVKACDAVPEKGADAARARYLRGAARLLLDEPAAAEKDFRAVLSKRKQSVPALTGLARALAAQDDHEQAEKLLRDAVKLDKKGAVTHRVLGEVLIAREKYSDARGILAKAWRLDPTSPLTAISLVDVHLGYGDDKSALKVAKALIKKRPDHPVGHFLAGRALEFKGKWKDALAAYETALEKDDTYLDAHRNLAILCQTQNPMYRDREMLDKAMKHYERYFELGGKAPELRRVYDQMAAFLEHIKNGGR